MKRVEAVETIHICVDCEKNDKVDIRAGGPHFLGYDFYVHPDEVDEMIEMIEKTVEPLLSVYESGKRLVRPKDVWTKEKILKCIKNGY